MRINRTDRCLGILSAADLAPHGGAVLGGAVEGVARVDGGGGVGAGARVAEDGAGGAAGRGAAGEGEGVAEAARGEGVVLAGDADLRAGGDGNDWQRVRWAG